jgi:TonB family protein
VLNCLTVTAQKIYYDVDSKVTRKKDASQYAVFTKTDSGYDASIFNAAEKRIISGHYSSLPSDLHKGRNGEFTYYFLNGKRSLVGMYVNDLRTGSWKSYLYSTGALNADTHYDHDSLDGLFINYHFATGKKLTEGQYVNGRCDGVWKYYLKNGSLVNETICTSGQIDQTKIFDSAGHVIRLLKYSNGTSTQVVAFDADGKEITSSDVTGESIDKHESLPEPTFNMGRFLGSNLHYPDWARENNVQGRVIISFIVDEDGSLKEANVVRSVTPSLDDEAMRVVNLMPKWKPGKINGEPLPVWFSLPVVFRLE